MNQKKIMVIAGEASGDALAAELVATLRYTASGYNFEFFGAGGPKMAAVGVDVVTDMTQHAAIGFGDVIKKYGQFRKIFNDLLALAVERRPDLILLVDFGAFNLRFATAIRGAVTKYSRKDPGWAPKIVQFVSPQVWASRSYRAKQIEKHVDLLLCLFPFEKPWYAEHAPKLRVEFVGHPIFDRYAGFKPPETRPQTPLVLLLPGSRSAELKRHLPVMLDAAKQMAWDREAEFRTVLPNESLAALTRKMVSAIPGPKVEIQVGNLAEALSQATVAMASTGTVLLECAYFGVPTVAMYKTSWGTYQIGKRIVSVKYLSMPNILANQLVYPEFVQDEATGKRISRFALDLIENHERREKMQGQLKNVLTSLGGPGATRRAATAILSLISP